MTPSSAPTHLDIQAFCASQSSLSGHEPLRNFKRLLAECVEQAAVSVDWQAEGQWRVGAGLSPSAWLHLHTSTTVPLICQRCLTPVQVPLQVNRWFRFVADEATAEHEDEDAEEDVLATSRDFSLQALIEDELLMELPAVAKHETCPVPLTLSVGEDELQASMQEQPKPFAALAGLKKL